MSPDTTPRSTTHGRPVVAAGSRAYLGAVRRVRWVSERFFHGAGMGKFHRAASRWVSPERMAVTVRLNPDSVFDFPASDSYWGSYLLEDRQYEPELMYVLNALRDDDWAFLDAGANFGYWSVLVTSQSLGAHQALAIEASPSTFAQLRRNCELNGGRFACRHLAITSDGSTHVAFPDSGAHAARSALPQQAGRATVDVPAASLASLIEQFDAGQPLIIKLDIEGLEAGVLRGSADELRAGGHIVLLESHYSDTSAEAIAACLEVGLQVVFVHDDGSAEAITDVAGAQRVKTQPGRGYNFVAFAPGGGPLAHRMQDLLGER